MATGADSVFYFEATELPSKLEPWSRPTISGKRLEQQPSSESVESTGKLLCPYTLSGELQNESELGIFINWLNDIHRSRLEERSCYQNGKREWYAWHENPPMENILQKKILFRDITDDPQFWIDHRGEIIPRHSVYYLVPRDLDIIEDLQSYLNTEQVKIWLEANCDQARDGYLRLQSKVLEELPVPTRFFRDSQAEAETSKA